MKILKASLLLLLVIQFVDLQAQDKTIKWGLYGAIKVYNIDQINDREENYSYQQNPTTLGAFLQYGKWEAELDYLVSNASVDLKYFVAKNTFVNLNASWNKQNYEIGDFRTYSDYSYIDGIDLYSYLAGMGYRYTYKRLKLQASALAGLMHSSKESDQTTVSPYYDRNLRIRKTDTYQLQPTFVYGGALDLELLPNFKKDRRRPLAIFASIQIVGTNKSKTYRKVSIEEWLAGNVVYQEESKPDKSGFDLLSFNFRAGLKIYFRK